MESKVNWAQVGAAALAGAVLGVGACAAYKGQEEEVTPVEPVAVVEEVVEEEILEEGVEIEAEVEEVE